MTGAHAVTRVTPAKGWQGLALRELWDYRELAYFLVWRDLKVRYFAEGSVRHIKGSHIVVPRIHPEQHAYILQNADQRIVFVIPYHDRYSLIGPTDIPVDSYERPAISEDETAIAKKTSARRKRFP